MGRFGPPSCRAAAQRVGLMTHLATADDDLAFARVQLERFDAADEGILPPDAACGQQRRSAAALFAACRVRWLYCSVAAWNRSSCARANATSLSAVARCVISPTTSAGGDGSSESP